MTIFATQALTFSTSKNHLKDVAPKILSSKRRGEVRVKQATSFSGGIKGSLVSAGLSQSPTAEASTTKMFAKETKTTAASELNKKKTKLLAMNRVYSNRMEDSVKTFCWECDQAISLSGLTKHLRGVHKKSVVDYR